MRGLVVPEREEDFTADPVELFFDLSFVFAFSRLVFHLVHESTWAGVGDGGLLFLMIWLPWTQFTWSANATSGSTREVRLLFLIATAASVPMSAGVTSAFDNAGAPFALSVSVIHLMGLGALLAGYDRGTPEAASARIYSLPGFAAIGFFIVGGYVDPDLRRAFWIVGMLIVIWSTVRAGEGEWVVRSGHFAERHGLIVIVALGEIIVAIGVPVVDTLADGESLSTLTYVSLAASGAFAGLMWWGYFDRPQPALEHRAGEVEGRDRGRYARDVYTYSHVPIVAGIILAAAALEEITLHPKDELDLAFRLMFAGGIALTLLGIAIAVFRAYRVIAKERSIAAAIIFLVLLPDWSVDGLVLLLVVDAIMLATLIFEHVRVERPRETSDAESASVS